MIPASTAFSPLWDILFVLRLALLPTLRAVVARPTLLLRPRALGQAFFTLVWKPMGDGVDANRVEIKEELIRSRAEGVVLDIGAGFGHTIKYLDLSRVSKYIAIEPNTAMHDGIRQAAVAANLPLSSLVIVSYGIQEIPLLLACPDLPRSSVNTIVSVLTLCSVPSPETTIPKFLDTFLAPGGRLLFYEHVQNPGREAQMWQRLWSPLWSLLFDGCQIGRDIVTIFDSSADWVERDVRSNPEESRDSLFPHAFGSYMKRS